MAPWCPRGRAWAGPLAAPTPTTAKIPATTHILRVKNRPGNGHDSKQAVAFLREVLDARPAQLGDRLPLDFRMMPRSASATSSDSSPPDTAPTPSRSATGLAAFQVAGRGVPALAARRPERDGPLSRPGHPAAPTTARRRQHGLGPGRAQGRVPPDGVPTRHYGANSARHLGVLAYNLLRGFQLDRPGRAQTAVRETHLCVPGPERTHSAAGQSAVPAGWLTPAAARQQPPCRLSHFGSG